MRLIRNGKVVGDLPDRRRAAGLPHATGEYEINDKQVNPTWYPAGLAVGGRALVASRPGPGNPLAPAGSAPRAPAIGLHGTYADYSVGTAASHGCMRMHIPDVEALYDQVTIGMKV